MPKKRPKRSHIWQGISVSHASSLPPFRHLIFVRCSSEAANLRDAEDPLPEKDSEAAALHQERVMILSTCLNFRVELDNVPLSLDVPHQRTFQG